MAVIMINCLKIKDMDNFRIDITSDNKEDFVSAFNIIMNNVPGNKAEGYKMDGDKLILYWHYEDNLGLSKFPRPMFTNDIINFVWSFISNSEYKEVDLDGSCGRAFRLNNDDWGYINGDYRAFIKVEIKTALYGK